MENLESHAKNCIKHRSCYLSWNHTHNPNSFYGASAIAVIKGNVVCRILQCFVILVVFSGDNKDWWCYSLSLISIDSFTPLPLKLHHTYCNTYMPYQVGEAMTRREGRKQLMEVAFYWLSPCIPVDFRYLSSCTFRAIYISRWAAFGQSAFYRPPVGKPLLSLSDSCTAPGTRVNLKISCISFGKSIVHHHQGSLVYSTAAIIIDHGILPSQNKFGLRTFPYSELGHFTPW